MIKKAQEKVLTKREAISLACDAAEFCGIEQSEIALLSAVMDTKVDTFLHGPLVKIPPQENQAT